MLRSITVAAIAAALFASASVSFAGRYGDDEVRHWQQIKKLQEAKQNSDKPGAAGRKAEDKNAKAAKDSDSFPFHKGPRSL